MNFDIDLVIPYVNGNDKDWLTLYKGYLKKHNITVSNDKCRFRDWGTFEYFIKSTKKFAPWVRKIHIILLNETQIPKWLDVTDSQINIVYHRNIIPIEFRPTFNSCTIEMFLKNINGLSEHFIYCNDDTFFIDHCEPTEFFNKKGTPKLFFYNKKINGNENQYRQVCINDNKLILSNFNKKLGKNYLKPKHTMIPMRLSTLNTVYEKNKSALLKSISALRNSKNYNQYIYSIYQKLNKESVNFENNSVYMDFQSNTIDEMIDVISNQKYKIICINDSSFVEDEKFVEYKLKLKSALEKLL